MSEKKFIRVCEIKDGEKRIVIEVDSAFYDTQEKIDALKEKIKKWYEGKEIRWYV